MDTIVLTIAQIELKLGITFGPTLKRHKEITDLSLF